MKAIRSTSRPRLVAIVCTGGPQLDRPIERLMRCTATVYAGMQRYASFLGRAMCIPHGKRKDSHSDALEVPFERHSVLGYRHRRLCSTQDSPLNYMCVGFQVRRVLSTFPLPRRNWKLRSSLGMEHRRSWSRRNQPTTMAPHSDSSQLHRYSRGAHLPELSRIALPPVALSLQRRA